MKWEQHFHQVWLIKNNLKIPTLSGRAFATKPLGSSHVNASALQRLALVFTDELLNVVVGNCEHWIT
jgi:hypothetical protein